MDGIRNTPAAVTAGALGNPEGPTGKKAVGTSMAMPRAGARNHLRPIENLLPRLEGVRKSKPGRWIARCPAHDDRRPSLSVRECDDGTLLLHCFSGCGAVDIVTAIGLELSDLFPPRLDPEYPPKRASRPPFDWRGFAEHSLTVLTAICLALHDIARGREIAESDREFLATAAERLLAILDSLESTEVGHG